MVIIRSSRSPNTALTNATESKRYAFPARLWKVCTLRRHHQTLNNAAIKESGMLWSWSAHLQTCLRRAPKLYNELRLPEMAGEDLCMRTVP